MKDERKPRRVCKINGNEVTRSKSNEIRSESRMIRYSSNSVAISIESTFMGYGYRVRNITGRKPLPQHLFVLPGFPP